MLRAKNLAISLWESVVDDLTKLLSIRFLFYGLFFYGLNWLVSHHGPSHDAWFGFVFAALFFIPTNKKTNIRRDKERQPPPSLIIFPTSSTSGKVGPL